MIISKLGVIMADRRVGVRDLSERVGIAPTNITKIKTNKIRAVRFTTLDEICKTLKCQPGDVLIYVDDDDESKSKTHIV